jgi:hypothetical protein
MSLPRGGGGIAGRSALRPVATCSSWRGRRGDASAQLVSALALIAEDPNGRLKELDHVWSQRPGAVRTGAGRSGG